MTKTKKLVSFKAQANHNALVIWHNKRRPLLCVVVVVICQTWEAINVNKVGRSRAPTQLNSVSVDSLQLLSVVDNNSEQTLPEHSNWRLKFERMTQKDTYHDVMPLHFRFFLDQLFTIQFEAAKTRARDNDDATTMTQTMITFDRCVDACLSHVKGGTLISHEIYHQRVSLISFQMP